MRTKCVSASFESWCLNFSMFVNGRSDAYLPRFEDDNPLERNVFRGLSLVADLDFKPGASVTPQAVGGGGGNAEGGSGLVGSQAGEETQFDELGVGRLFFGKLGERFVDVDQVPCAERRGDVDKFELMETAASLFGKPG